LKKFDPEKSGTETMLRKPFQLGMIQMRVIPGAKQRNLRHATDCIARAAAGGAEVVLLPEAIPLGWTDPSALTEADAIPEGASCLCLREAARTHGVWVCAGLIEREENQIFNSAVLINSAGEIVLRHRKINELEIARPLYAIGTEIAVSETPWGIFGVMICADAFIPGQVISRKLASLGAAAILSPCSWAVPPDHDNRKEPYGKLWLDNYVPVAREFGIWIAGVSNVGPIEAGPWAGRKCIGSSLLISPEGTPVLQGSYDAESILHMAIDRRHLPPQ
jgi:predicted amidohydrolase